MRQIYYSKLSCLLLLTLFATISYGQNVISGQIEDDIEPLIGANVVIKGTTNGTQTDFKLWT